MASIYVDETSGSDLTGVGSQEAPYQSLAHALFAQGQSATVLIRKDPSADYEEPTQSALKKAKKGADGLEKKRRKAEELAEREARAQGEEREKRERLIEESKKIQLVEDATLPTAVKVRAMTLVRRDLLIDIDSTIHRQRSRTSNLCAKSASVFLVGCTAYALRRISYLLSSETAPDTCKPYSLAYLCVPGSFAQLQDFTHTRIGPNVRSIDTDPRVISRTGRDITTDARRQDSPWGARTRR